MTTANFVMGDTLASSFLLAVILGILFGISFGMIEYYLENRFFRRKSLGRVMILKAILSLIVSLMLFYIIRYVLFVRFIAPVVNLSNIRLNDESWRYIFYLFLIQTSFMNIIISFINQMNKKFGPGILLPLLLGKYRNPREEERIFMFMDLQSSTTIAESLGHIKYSAFIQESFMDINDVVPKFRAEIYQYVGDEIVISWTVSEGLRESSCIAFYFACEAQFNKKAIDYTNEYGIVPKFKAGLHLGKVTAVEIGEIKRDIAYHGDTLNTAARIQSVCNDHGKYLLASKEMIDCAKVTKQYVVQSMGEVLLKGKRNLVEIMSIEQC
ncbi:adenylate/guanylate cyclase domain-containing protein [Arcicella aquatica]|uniref:Adenylate/guanylate cyclase domain-containing protein n=1 Tax=Arcicella aquatica TaxID=217141 RepID=A0ABU5QH49_9BACT|nr:adenylate/guanylate cyclase domain-containing protein [Arcicella aquatica]MEA5256378.1 adenylate/guanylate cyclase domain-containing protein [Arcicella aquatica]